jgi:hypothetical protein
MKEALIHSDRRFAGAARARATAPGPDATVKDVPSVLPQPFDAPEISGRRPRVADDLDGSFASVSPFDDASEPNDRSTDAGKGVLFQLANRPAGCE